ncbi:hypothetical protein [Pseudopedobacter sp.]|uniref:hypothetical protein n=1 Tax=Pseudopedobacter sp. TaxID=1936787 RepID=UPI0033404355
MKLSPSPGIFLSDLRIGGHYLRVTVESTTFIKVVCTRSFYTKDGWQTAETISLYEKFSNVN